MVKLGALLIPLLVTTTPRGTLSLPTATHEEVPG